MTSEVTKIDWEKRRTNFRVLLALKGTNATAVAKEVDLSTNTLSKFASGATKTLSAKSLDLAVQFLGLTSANDLDVDNPIDNPRVQLRKLVEAIPDAEVDSLLSELRFRFQKTDR